MSLRGGSRLEVLEIMADRTMGITSIEGTSEAKMITISFHLRTSSSSCFSVSVHKAVREEISSNNSLVEIATKEIMETRKMTLK